MEYCRVEPPGRVHTEFILFSEHLIASDEVPMIIATGRLGINPDRYGVKVLRKNENNEFFIFGCKVILFKMCAEMKAVWRVLILSKARICGPII